MRPIFDYFYKKNLKKEKEYIEIIKMAGELSKKCFQFNENEIKWIKKYIGDINE